MVFCRDATQTKEFVYKIFGNLYLTVELDKRPLFKIILFHYRVEQMERIQNANMRKQKASIQSLVSDP